MTFELDLTCIKIKWYTKFQINMSKHVGEKCGKLWRTDGRMDGRTRTDGRTDGHHHTIIRPVSFSWHLLCYFSPLGRVNNFWLSAIEAVAMRCICRLWHIGLGFLKFSLNRFASLILIVCLTSHATLFQLYMWQHIDVQAEWRSLTYGRAPNAIDIS